MKLAPLTFSIIKRQLAKGQKDWWVMDAKYNWIIDNPYIRVALNIVAFAAWFVVGWALLAA